MNDNWQQLNHLVVTRRLPNEKNDIKEFVRPSDVAVREVYEGQSISQHLNSASDRDKVVAFLSWVCQNIKYPKDENIARLISYDGYSVKINDYWQFPAETLAGPRIGDCDSCSNLLASLIRNFASPKDAYVVLGGYKSNTMNHAWVEWNDLILEPTKDIPPAQVFEHSGDYKAMVRYNDKEIWVKGNSANYEWLQDIGSSSLVSHQLVRDGRSQAIVDAVTYQDMSTYRKIELGEFRIVDVPDIAALFAAIEDEVARQGDILLKQELWTDSDGYLLKVWVAPQSPILWFLIPIAITAVAGAVIAWKASQILPNQSVGNMVLVGVIVVAALAGGVYLLAKR